MTIEFADLKPGNEYTRKDGRACVFVGPHPYDGATLVMYDPSADDEGRPAYFDCERHHLTEKR